MHRYRIEFEDEKGGLTGVLHVDTLLEAESIVLNRKIIIDHGLNLLPNNNRYATIWEETNS